MKFCFLSVVPDQDFSIRITGSTVELKCNTLLFFNLFSAKAIGWQ